MSRTDRELRRVTALALQAARLEVADPRLASEYRRKVTRRDPLAFAVIYLAHHLTSPLSGRITLSKVHVDWADDAKAWMTPPTEPRQNRTATVAPRETGKSTWRFLLLPMWAAAHGWVRFAAAFADTDTQAQTHLASFKAELDNNALLRRDYGDLVVPKTRGRGTVEADRVSLYHAKSSFVFAAAGMDSSNLGLKVGDTRPDLLILDDIEPHEARYSAGLKAKRLDTLLSAILPLNINAIVVMAGTVTMVGSIMHDIVRYHRGERDTLEDGRPDPDGNGWVGDERIVARHYPAIVTDKRGRRRSIWPAKWSLRFLESIEGTRSYLKNYANDPLGADGDYWTIDDFHRGTLQAITRRIISIDPAVTSKVKGVNGAKKSSDYTGIAVIAYEPSTHRAIVEKCVQVRLAPDKLRLYVIQLINETGAGGVLVETNQGGDLWVELFAGMFHDFPVPVKTVHQSVKKEQRAASVLVLYQRSRVLHLEGADLTTLEQQMVAFPNAPHDDMVDAVGSGVAYFLDKKRRLKAGAWTAGYAA
jgi:predicted phage terminase large subunit-like protein